MANRKDSWSHKNSNNNSISSSKPNFLSSSSKNKSYNKRNRYGLCLICDNPKTHSDWCQQCNSENFRKKFNHWTSGNELIDNFIKDFQLNAKNDRQILEWIPYDQFREFQFIARGGFAKVYSAIWKDGFIKRWDHEKGEWERRKDWRVALKTMHNSAELSSEFFDEIKACVKCGGGFGLIRCYGISRNPDTDDFIIVLYYANRGNLRNYLEQHYGELDWKQKLIILKQIAEGLKNIHQLGYVHRDFHSGNILQSKNAEIADLGFTGPADKDSTGVNKKSKPRAVYGVLPYLSPEVLRGGDYTTESDIYSFGIIMWEVSECIPPFSDRAHDAHLALDICRGERPACEDYIPKSFVKLIKRCWNATPKKRPNAYELYQTFQEWYWDLKEGKENEITAEFNGSDHNYSQLSSPASSRTVTVTHPLAVYTSRLLNFPDLPEPVNAPYRKSSIPLSRSIDTIIEEIEEEPEYCTRQYEDDLVYVSDPETKVTPVTFDPKDECVTRQYEDDLVYVPDPETIISPVTFDPEDEYVTRQYDTEIPWEGL